MTALLLTGDLGWSANWLTAIASVVACIIAVITGQRSMRTSLDVMIQKRFEDFVANIREELSGLKKGLNVHEKRLTSSAEQIAYLKGRFSAVPCIKGTAQPRDPFCPDEENSSQD